jgi:hypothetical protein
MSQLNLPDSAIVYRVLLRKQWLDKKTKEINYDALYLRQKKQEVGLSVNLASACSLEECAAQFRNYY